MSAADASRTYVIERHMPGAGKLSGGELRDIARTSCAVLDDLGPSIRWIHSYVTDDTIYCIYSAPDERLIRQHSEQGGFPADTISQVRSIIDPSTALE